jgi:hypothetical protein
MGKCRIGWPLPGGSRHTIASMSDLAARAMSACRASGRRLTHSRAQRSSRSAGWPATVTGSPHRSSRTLSTRVAGPPGVARSNGAIPAPLRRGDSIPAASTTGQNEPALCRRQQRALAATGGRWGSAGVEPASPAVDCGEGLLVGVGEVRDIGLQLLSRVLERLARAQVLGQGVEL